jgi:hypothetical protein
MEKKGEIRRKRGMQTIKRWQIHLFLPQHEKVRQNPVKPTSRVQRSSGKLSFRILKAKEKQTSSFFFKSKAQDKPYFPQKVKKKNAEQVEQKSGDLTRINRLLLRNMEERSLRL